MEQVDKHGRFITLIHFMYRPEPLIDRWRIACMPNMTEFHETKYHPNYQRTNEPRAVTCLACHRTEAYKQSVTLNTELPKLPGRGTPREMETIR